MIALELPCTANFVFYARLKDVDSHDSQQLRRHKRPIFPDPNDARDAVEVSHQIRIVFIACMLGPLGAEVGNDCRWRLMPLCFLILNREPRVRILR